MSAIQQEHFVMAVVPAVVYLARRRFFRLRADEREELIAEAIAAAFVSYASLVRRGKDAVVTPYMLALFAVKHVCGGRHVGGSQESTTDVRSRRCKEKGLTVVQFSQLPQPIREALQEDHRTPVPDQAAFRIDFASFLARHTATKRRAAVLLATGIRAKDVADAIGLSRGRITQIRKELAEDWDAYNSV